MNERNNSDWPGVPFNSDAWPFSTHYYIFEARRAIAQSARTMFGAIPFGAAQDNVPHEIVGYLSCVHQLSRAMKTITEDLVAEARANGVTWQDIGRAFDQGPTAAQKRYGEAIQDAGRLFRLRDEAAIAERTAELSDNVHGEIEEEWGEEWSGTSHAERLSYARSLISEIAAKLTAASTAQDSDSYDLFITNLGEAAAKVNLLTRTLILDRDTWDTLAGWSYPDARPSSIYVKDPAAYLYLFLQYVMLLQFQFERIVQSDDPIGERMMRIRIAHHLVHELMLLLLREDVSTTIRTHDEDLQVVA